MTRDERDDANGSQALTGGDITKYTRGTHQLLVTRSTRSQRRQSHPVVGVSCSDHERWMLYEGMRQEAAGGVSVHCRK